MRFTKFWNQNQRFLFYLFLLSIVKVLLLTGCSAPKNITYFRDIPDSIKLKTVPLAEYNTPIIQADDILDVSIQTLDAGSAPLISQQNSSGYPLLGTGSSLPGMASTPGVTPKTTGYVVDKQGFVILPLIGKVSVVGQTTDQVRDNIQKKAEEYYKEPVVNVRFANFKITVIGEVTKPSTYIMPNEKVTLLDAIGIAGDLTIFGKRENVLLIRENNGKKDFVRFNLNDSKLFASPYFYLHQGDVIYVEPNQSKVRSTDMAQVRNVSIFTSVLSVLIIVATRIKF